MRPVNRRARHRRTAGQGFKGAEDARLWNAAIVDSSDDAIVATNLEGVILGWNVGAERMFGYTEEEAIGQPITIIIPLELRDEENEILRLLRTGKRIEHYETVRVSKSGKIIDLSITTVPVRDAEGRIIGASGIARDITERQRARTAARESEERFRLVADAAPVMIWMSGVDKLRTYFNQPWLEFTGRSLAAELGNGWAEGVHPGDLERCLDTYTKAFDQRNAFHMEYRLRRHDGEHRWILDSGVPRFNIDRSFGGYIGSAIDITERKLAEETLSKVSQRLIEAHEEERARIARELHDDINQRLVLLSINLDHLKPTLRSSAPDFEEAIKTVRDLASDIHGLSHRLHSPKLEYLGLAAAAASFCRELANRQKVEIDFHGEGLPKELPKEIALCLYRVLQEALQNATKYSGSHHFEVSLSAEANQIQLTVRDWGIGFDTAVAMKGHGLGLISMKERLKLVEGELSIESQPQRGTTIHARAPLKERMKAAGAG